jgi:peptide/nickel transport system permease protein
VTLAIQTGPRSAGSGSQSGTSDGSPHAPLRHAEDQNRSETTCVNVLTLDSQDLPTAWGPDGAAGGALVGALVALPTGPGGAAAGTAAGAAAASSGAAAGTIGGGTTGTLADLTNWGLKADYLDTAATYLLPGKTAVVAEVEEGSTGSIDAAVMRHGGIVYREPVTVTLAAVLIGSALGLMSGYFPRLDTPIMRTLDGLMAFPSILLAIAIMASLGTSAVNVFIALVVVYTPTIARLVRSTTLVTRQQPFVESARSIGMTDSQVLLRYVYPNGLSPLIVQCTFVVAFAIISEASLSFLGAGVDPETPTWGNMLRDGQRVLQSAWWLALFPGIALVLTVLTLNLLGDALRDALDPRARDR